MKFVFITNRYPPDQGGMSRSCARIVNALRDRAHEVHLVRLSAEPAIHQTGSAPAHASFSSFDTLVDPGKAEQAYFHLNKQFAQAVFIGFGGGYPSYLATLWARWSGAKSISLMRGNDFDRLIHDAKQGWMVHNVLENADLVGAVSTEMCARIRALRNRPVCFTPNGIDHASWEVFPPDRLRAAEWRGANSRKGKSVIGVFGQLKSKKGLDLALDVFNSARIKERAQMLTVGDVPEQMQNLLSEKLGANWLNARYCVDDELISFYLACDFVFIPSLSDGMPNVLLEAMVTGVPVIASDAGAMPDVLIDKVDGIVFKAGDCIDAERAVYEALNLNAEQRAKQSAAAKRKVLEKYTPHTEAKILEDAIYSHVLNGAGHGL